MAVTVQDERGARELAIVAQPTGQVVSATPVQMTRVRALNTFHTVALGASAGITVANGDEFDTPTPHAEDLKRQGLAEAVEAEAPTDGGAA